MDEKEEEQYQIPDIKKQGDLDIKDLKGLDQLIRPYFEGHWENKLKTNKMEIDFELKVLETKNRHNRFVLLGLFAIAAIVLLLSFYLFLTGRDKSAMDLVVIVILVTTSALAGYGWSKSKRESDLD